MEVHHIGYLVKNIHKSQEAFESLGFVLSKEKTYDPIRDAFILFMNMGEKKGTSCIELISPASDASPIYNLLKNFKNVPYHICFSTQDLHTEVARLKQTGWTIINPATPAPAIDGKQVVFLLNRHIGIMELVEEK